MQRLSFLVLGILLIAAGCVSEQVNEAQQGQKAIQDAKTVTQQSNNATCMQCGDSCIPTNMAAYSQCAQSTKQVTCVFKDNACQVAN